MGRLATPREVAAAALHLASDDAAFITGTGLLIDSRLVAG
jgi:NAD(P)-dependent dehydrogenase (short-subunit alcohol dehydrogenase family)